MIESYATEKIKWRKVEGKTDMGDAKLSEEKTLFGFFTYNRKLISNRVGEEVVSEAKLDTKCTDIDEGDVVICDGKEWTVMQCSPKRNLARVEQFRVLRL